MTWSRSIELVKFSSGRDGFGHNGDKVWSSFSAAYIDDVQNEDDETLGIVLEDL